MGTAPAGKAGARGVRIHVTGAAGFLGTELVKLAPGATGDRVEVRDANALAQLFGRLRPEVVIHTAYRQDGDGAREIVVDGSENVARAAAAVGARLVHVSTDVIFDGLKGAPYVEADPPSPCTDYGRAKADAEARVTEIAPAALLVRTSLIVGGPGHAPSKHELAALDAAATFYDNEIRSPIQVGDLAAALLELASLDVSGPLNVAGADDVSRAELAELVAGRPVRRAPAPPGRPLDCSLDSSRARSLLQTEVRGVRSVFAKPTVRTRA
jgi:dTDP-4-dehydrorhamnose reductase